SPEPILLDLWAEGKDVGSERMQLARKQFEFYAADLKNGNPFSSEANVPAVMRGRSYLASFSGLDRDYQVMLAAAGKESVNFNRNVRDSAQVIINNKELPAAFTKDGYAYM